MKKKKSNMRKHGKEYYEKKNKKKIKEYKSNCYTNLSEEEKKEKNINKIVIEIFLRK